MPTYTAKASLKYWAGSGAAVSGEARSGYYNGTPYSGMMTFSVAALGDMSNINVSAVTLNLAIGALGGAYTKDIIVTHTGKTVAIGTFSKSGCRNTTVSLTWSTGNQFTSIKGYLEGLTGGYAYFGVISHAQSRGSGGNAYDYDYLNITAATLTLTYTNKKSTGTVGNLTINSASGNSATLKITTHDNSYKHKVTWSIGSNKSSTNVAAGTTSVPMLVPPGWLPSSTTGTVTVTLETLNANNTSLGSNTYTFKATIADVTAMKPSIGTMTVSPQYTGVSSTAQGWGLYIQGKTKARLAATTITAGAGAKLASYQITTSPSYGSASKTGLTATSASTTQFDSGNLTSSGSITIKLKVTDSRGRTNEATVTKTIYAYASPKVSNAKAVRCNSSGSEQPTAGTYAKITLDYSCSGVNSNNKVTTVEVTVKGKKNTPVSGGSAESGSTNTIIGGNSGTTYGLETDTAYNAEIAVTDKVGTVTKVNITVPSAAYILHIRKGGKSMGIGKAASTTANRLDIKWATEMEGALTVKNEIAAQPDSGRAYVRIIPAQDQHGDITFGRSGNQIWALSGRNSTDKFFGLFNYGLSEWAMRIDETTDALTLAKPLTIANGGHGKTTAAAGFAALSDPQLNVAWKDAPVGISHYFYESSTAAADYDLPSNYVEVIVMKRSDARGVALAYRWSNQSGGIWKNNLHGSWQGWVADGDYYRTGEEAIGTWTDGKVLYRYSCTGSTTSTGDITTSQTLPRTPDSIIKITGGFYSSADSAWRPIPFVTYYNINQAFSAVVTSDNKVHLYIGSGLTGTKTWKLVIEYTA